MEITELTKELIINIIMLTVAVVISFFIIYSVWLMATGICKVAKHEDELIEKEMKNKMERKENDKSI